MNVFRSFARSLWSTLAFRQKPKDDGARSPGAGPAPAPVSSRLRDGFERAYRSRFAAPAQGDGFEAAARSAPLDLTGGVKRAYLPMEAPGPAPAINPSDFVASLDDLALLMQSAEPTIERAPQAPADAAPLAQADDVGPGPLEGESPAVAPVLAQPDDVGPALLEGSLATLPAAELQLQPTELGAAQAPAPIETGVSPPDDGRPTATPSTPEFEAWAAAAKLSRAGGEASLPPPDDGLLTLDAFAPVVDAFEPTAAPPVAEAEPPRAVTLDAFGPVVDAFEPAPLGAGPAPAPPSRAPPQHTVNLLMPASRAVEARPEAVEHFSTVELFEAVEQLTQPEPASQQVATPPEPHHEEPREEVAADPAAPAPASGTPSRP